MPTLEDFLNHPVETLEKALHLRKQIDNLNQALKELFGPSPVSLGGVQTNVPRQRGTRKKKRTMSAEGRARVAAAQRARWAAQKATHGPETAIALERAKEKQKRGRPPGSQTKAKSRRSSESEKTASPSKKTKRTISPEGLARIKAAQKLRWAKVKKAGK